MVDLVALRKQNAARWAVAKITRPASFTPVAARLFAKKSTYVEISQATAAAAPGSIPVPWWFIAVVHEREASQDFSRSIAQGDRWDRVSTDVPVGRGPFKSFEDAAIDALLRCAPKVALNRDWSIGAALTILEGYNGYGYALGPTDIYGAKHAPMPSPYIWSGTDQYVEGKYVADHRFDPRAVDVQLGCAGLILALMRLDPSISFGTAPTVAPTLVSMTTPKPTVKPPAAPASFGTVIAGLLSSIFRR